MINEIEEMTAYEKRVFQMIPFGIDNLISTTEIEQVMKINKRNIMGIIENLVLKYNLPIGSMKQSNKFGYFIATNEEEKNIGTYSNERLMMTLQKRVNKIKNADLDTAYLYKEKYKDEIIECEEQPKSETFILPKIVIINHELINSLSKPNNTIKN